MSKDSNTDPHINSSLCILPWVHVQLNQDGSLLPCCRTDETYVYGKLDSTDVQSAWNAAPIREMRRSMLKGERLKQCSDCYKVEASGGVSLRQQTNETYKDAFDRLPQTSEDGTVANGSLLYLGIRFSNVCNFRCRTCSASNSLSWHQDAKAAGMTLPSKPKLTPRSSFAELKRELEPMIPTLRSVYFAGGESLLDEGHYKFLEMLLKAGRTDIILHYNTNFSKLTLGEWNVLKLWRQFKTVLVGASLDGVGRHAELIRKGTDWKETLANFNRLRILENAKFFVYCSVSVLNCFHLPEAIDEWLRLRMIHEPGMLDINIVAAPSYFNVSVMNERERDLLRAKYRTYFESLEKRVRPEMFRSLKQQLDLVLASMVGEADPNLRTMLREMTMKIDSLRNEKLADLVPELNDLLGGAPQVARA